MDGAAAGGKNFFHDHHTATAKVAANRRRSITPKIDAEPSSDGASSSAWSIFHQPGGHTNLPPSLKEMKNTSEIKVILFFLCSQYA
jgi:hypothetical protein